VEIPQVGLVVAGYLWNAWHFQAWLSCNETTGTHPGVHGPQSLCPHFGDGGYCSGVYLVLHQMHWNLIQYFEASLH
jgi:hypothetical protein